MFGRMEFNSKLMWKCKKSVQDKLHIFKDKLKRSSKEVEIRLATTILTG